MFDDHPLEVPALIFHGFLRDGGKIAMLNHALLHRSYRPRRIPIFMPMLAWVFIMCPAQSGVLYEQVPQHDGGYLSGIGPPPYGVIPLIAVADDFLLNQAATIKNVTWWGGYGANTVGIPRNSPDDFTIRFFRDNGGNPGDLLSAFPVGDSASRSATGDFNPPPDPMTGFPGAEEFKYSICLETGFQAEANTKYWLSIFNAITDDYWLWEHSATPGVGLEIQRSFSDPVVGPWQPFVDVLDNPLGNAAFQLNDAEICPEPTSFAMLGTGVLGLLFAARKRQQMKLAS